MLGGSSPAVSVERLYTQDGARNGVFGDRWLLSLDESLTLSDDSSYVLRRGNGRIDRFAQAASSNTFFALSATQDVMARAGNGGFTVTSPAGVVRTFDSAGRLLEIRDGAIPRAALEYDSAGRISVVRSHGRSLRFSYEDSRLSSVSDSAGRTVAYAYDADGRLTRQTNADGSVVEYGYTSAGLLSSVVRQGAASTIEYSGDPGFAAVSKVTLPDGSTRTYGTPRTPREVQVTRREGVTSYVSNALGLLESVADASGNQTLYVNDSAGRRTRVVNGAGEVLRFEYDPAGNPTALVEASGARWTADYSDGRATRIADPFGRAWQFGYESGVLSAVAPPAGLPSSSRFNSSGAMVEANLYGIATTYEYNSDGLISKVTDATGASASYQYDAAGRVESRLDASGSVRAEYGSGSRPTGYTAGSSTIPAGQGIERDALGRPAKSTDAFGVSVAYSWDAAGRLARVTLPGDRSVSYEYDRAGRLSKVADSLGNFAVYSYDPAGYPASVNVSGGPVTVYQYDAARNLRAVVSTGPDGAPVAAYRYTLDAASNRTALAALEPFTKPFTYPAATYGYNAAGRTVSRDNSSFSYDGRGLLSGIEGGPALRFSYDAFGRLESVSGDFSANYVYDGAGPRIGRTVNGQTRRFVYDRSGARPRMVMETDGSGSLVAWYVHGLAPLWMVDASGRAYYYHYDGSGNVVALSNPSSGVVNRYRYDALNRLVGTDETVANPLRARAAAGAIDDGNGILYLNGSYVLPDSFLALRGTVDLSPPVPDLTPPLPPPARCLFAGPASCALSGAGRQQ